MKLSKEQAEAAFDAMTATARRKHQDSVAIRNLAKRKAMPISWRLYALLAGAGIGAGLYWFIPSQHWFWIAAISMPISVGIAQSIWNRRVKI